MNQMRIVDDSEGEVALDDLARKVRTVLDESGGGGGICFPAVGAALQYRSLKLGAAALKAWRLHHPSSRPTDGSDRTML